MTHPQRTSVKKRTLSRQETLQRLRDEFTDQMGKDREALRARLRSHMSDPSDPEDNIDSLVEEFLNELLGVDEEPIFDDHAMEAIDDWQTGLVKCPLCPRGWLLEPFAGVITCDGCSDFRVANVSLTDLAALLDATIKTHQAHGEQAIFQITGGALYSTCRSCGSWPVLDS